MAYRVIKKEMVEGALIEFAVNTEYLILVNGLLTHVRHKFFNKEDGRKYFKQVLKDREIIQLYKELSLCDCAKKAGEA